MRLTVTEISVIVVVVLLGFFAKGVTGMGGPLLIIPELAGFTGLEFSAAAMAIPALVTNSVMLRDARSEAKGTISFLRPLLLAGVAGTVIGAGMTRSA